MIALENGHPVGEVLLTGDVIAARETEIATQLIEIYDGQDPLFISVLVGGGPFAIDLMEAIVKQRARFHPRLDFIRAKTYESGKDAGETKITIPLSEDLDLSDRPVAVIDDLCDKNLTLPAVDRYLRESHAAKNILSVVLMNKPGDERLGPEPDIVGFQIPKRWVAGRGPDAGNKEIPDAFRYLEYVTAID